LELDSIIDMLGQGESILDPVDDHSSNPITPQKCTSLLLFRVNDVSQLRILVGNRVSDQLLFQVS